MFEMLKKYYNINNINKINFKKIFSDIRTWIILAFIIRLYNINLPPLDGSHTWREVDGLDIARNFLEINSNFFFPRISFSENKTGITGMEGPVLNYLIFLFSKIFGFHIFIGRLINLFISSLGIFYFYKIIYTHFNKKLAFNSALLVLFSIWFAYSRKIIPDIFGASLGFISIYYALNFFYKSKKNTLFLIIFAITATFACLVKITITLMFCVLVFPIFDKSVKFSKKLILITISIISFLPVVWWYFIWVPHLNTTFGINYFFMGRPILEGLRQIKESFFIDFAPQIYKSQMRYLGFLFYCIGIFLIIKNKNKFLLKLWILSLIVLFIFMIKAGVSFHHTYYSVWWMPSMALIAAWGLEKLSNLIKLKKNKYIITFLVLVCFENFANGLNTFRIQENKEFLLNIEKLMDRFTNRSTLISINSAPEPQYLFYTHRKGWISSNTELSNKDYLNKIYEQGCRYILILKKIANKDLILDKNFKIIFENEDLRLYSF